MRHVLKSRIYVFIIPMYNKAIVYENSTEEDLLLSASGLEGGPLLGIATLYGLDGPGIESRCGYFPHPSIPALAPTQPGSGFASGVGGVKRPWSGIDNPLQSSNKVKERVDLICSPQDLHGLS